MSQISESTLMRPDPWQSVFLKSLGVLAGTGLAAALLLAMVTATVSPGIEGLGVGLLLYGAILLVALVAAPITLHRLLAGVPHRGRITGTFVAAILVAGHFFGFMLLNLWALPFTLLIPPLAAAIASETERRKMLVAFLGLSAVLTFAFSFLSISNVLNRVSEADREAIQAAQLKGMPFLAPSEDLAEGLVVKNFTGPRVGAENWQITLEDSSKDSKPEYLLSIPYVPIECSTEIGEGQEPDCKVVGTAMVSPVTYSSRSEAWFITSGVYQVQLEQKLGKWQYQSEDQLTDTQAVAILEGLESLSYDDWDERLRR